MMRNNKFKDKNQFKNSNTSSKAEELAEIEKLSSSYAEISPSNVRSFTDFPLSSRTLEGLKASKYSSPTDIQREAIGLALQSNDVLGAAKTGSGKTLAFLIPVLECLYRQRWTQYDGMGALIISPTRELAYQTFEVLRKVGRFHDFSAGLVIGGKHMKEESECIASTNIVICTPGRLLQHMDQTANFSADNLQVLVLDEADRILDLGFQETMNAIIDNLPSTRQTLLFSATQTKSVKDLARLSLHQPVYVSVHEKSQYSTPAKLKQSYIVCPLESKLNVLWSFLRNHLRNKILVFLSSCKQVRFFYEAFCRLHPGVTLLNLHGNMDQLKRMAVYDQFCRKQHAVLLATDIAARGLDFPAVDWVVQLDCPEDSTTYIHRVGRTARSDQGGEALSVFLPSEEEAMLAELQARKIPIDKIEINPKKLFEMERRMESLLASDTELKSFAQRAFVSYLKCIHLMKNKKIFDVKKLDLSAYSKSLGLAVAPRVRFLERKEKELQKNKKAHSNSLAAAPTSDSSASNKQKRLSLPEGAAAASSDDDENEGSGDSGQMRSIESFDALAYDDKDDDGFLTVKSKSSPASRKRKAAVAAAIESADEEESNLLLPPEKLAKQSKRKVTKASLAKRVLKKKLTVNTQVKFDADGQPIVDVHKQSTMAEEEDADAGGITISEARARMTREDQFDKQLFRQKVKQKHTEKRLKEKKKRQSNTRGRQQQDDDEPEVQLGSPDDNGDDDGDYNNYSSDDN